MRDEPRIKKNKKYYTWIYTNDEDGKPLTKSKERKYDKKKGLFFDTRLPSYNTILNFKLPKKTKDNLTPEQVKLIERKLLLDEMMIKKISNTINYDKFNIEEFRNVPKKHTNKVVGKDVEDIIISFQKELPTGFYEEDKEKVLKDLKDILNKSECSEDVKEFLLEKVVPIKGSRYNFSKISQKNKNRRSRNYYNKYLKDKHETYEKYEKDYIKQQKALFDEFKNKSRRGITFLNSSNKAFCCLM